MTIRHFPIHLKLTIGTLVPLFFAIFICWVTGISIITTRISSQAQEKVRTDLNAAREIYLNDIEHIRDVVKFTGQTPYTASAVSSGNRQELSAILAPLRLNEQLDILNAVDLYGRVIFRSGNPEVSGDYHQAEPLVARALRGEVVSGTMVIPPEALERENPELASRAVVTIQSTPRGRVYSKKVEQSGLMLVSAAPVRDRSGRIVGALYGGVMLNGTTALVDKIKRIVYEGGRPEGQNIGTATIFLNDVRISTNVLTPSGGRAIGTQLSEEIYSKVIVNHERWTGRAFVVNDWYFSAYEPILDLNGVVVGALYVGMLEKPFIKINTRLNLLFAGVLLFGSLAGISLSAYIGSRLARPIRVLELSVRRIAAGERGVRIEVQTSDEIGALANEFNEMTKALNLREEEINSLNRQLERKVLERTAQLEENSLLLSRTQQELVRAGKLADLGILAAGVAHEINNPMAIIRGNAELLQMAIPARDMHREEVDTIVQQVLRVERIVADLLQFARQEQIRLGRVALNPMLTEILRQVVHQVPLTGIELRQDYATQLPELEGDGMQLRQVFTNLVLNAIQAMPEGGILTVATAVSSEGNSCVVTVSDSGCGIPPEQLEIVFNPFFTTRRGGTGLGLSVSYGIVRDHGGSIDVASEPGHGTSFRVTLPVPTDRTPAA